MILPFRSYRVLRVGGRDCSPPLLVPPWLGLDLGLEWGVQEAQGLQALREGVKGPRELEGRGGLLGLIPGLRCR